MFHKFLEISQELCLFKDLGVLDSKFMDLNYNSQNHDSLQPKKHQGAFEGKDENLQDIIIRIAGLSVFPHVVKIFPIGI